MIIKKMGCCPPLKHPGKHSEGHTLEIIHTGKGTKGTNPTPDLQSRSNAIYTPLLSWSHCLAHQALLCPIINHKHSAVDGTFEVKLLRPFHSFLPGQERGSKLGLLQLTVLTLDWNFASGSASELFGKFHLFFLSISR